MLGRLQNRGYAYSLGIAINRTIPAWLFRFRVFSVFRLEQLEGTDSLRAYDDDIRFAWAQTDDDRILAEQSTHYQPYSQAHTHQACLAFDGDQPIGGVWIAKESFYETDLGLKILLQPNQSWLFAAYISKSHRQRGIYRRMLRYALQSQTDRQVLAAINPTNKASIAAHQSMISETLGTSIAARLFSFACCVCKGRLRTIQALGLGLSNPTKISA